MHGRWWLGVSASLLACEPGLDSPPTIPTPIDCAAYSGPEVGTWRRVTYPAGAATYSVTVDDEAFIVPGSVECLFCQLSALAPGESEWQAQSYPDPLPSARAVDGLIATTDFIVAVGLRTMEQNLAAYGQVAVLDRASGTWTLHPFPEDFLPRYEIEVHWTGTEVLLWGGYDSNRSLLDPDWMPDADWQVTVHSDGLRFDPATGAFRRIPPALSPVTTGTGQGRDPRQYLRSVWTPEGLVIWGVHPGEFGAFLGRYSPEEDTWSTLEAMASPPRREGHQLLYSDGYVYVFSGKDTQGGADGNTLEARCSEGLDESCWDLWRLHLETLEWEQVEVPDFVGLHASTVGSRRTAAFVDGRLMAGGRACPGVAIYDPELNQWTRSTLAGAPREPFAVHSVGGELYLSGTRDPAAVPGGALWIFDP